MKKALEIVQFLSYSSNAEISKVSSWGNVKNEALNGLNRAVRVLWNSKEWNFRREIKKINLNSGKSSVGLSNCILGQDGLRVDNDVLFYDKDVPFYDAKTGKPDRYYITNKDKIILYPTPDDNYTLFMETFSTMPIVASDDTKKTTFTEEDDILNITERLEPLFIDCLNYFCNEILNGDVTDEEYQEHTLRYSEVYKLLEKADQGSLDNDNNRGFLMPWQL